MTSTQTPLLRATERASDTVRRHRYELLILAGTAAFVAIVALLSVAALFG